MEDLDAYERRFRRAGLPLLVDGVVGARGRAAARLMRETFAARGEYLALRATVRP